MLIQNISNTVQAAPSIGNISNDASNNDAPNVVVAQAPPPVQQPSPEQVKSAVQDINHALQQSHPNLQFSIDSVTHTPVVTLTDSTTNQVIVQFPSQEALAIAAAIDQSEKRQGLLLNQKA
jgi:flagellar protein FlaG